MERGIARSAGTVAAAVALSRVSGLVREMVMARLFGAGQAYDAFLLGFRVPNLTRDLFAEGALSAAFVPVFSEYLAKKGRREAAALSNLVATALLVVVGALCLLGILASPFVVRLLAPGYARVPGKFELAVTLTRVMFPFLLLVALAAQAMGVLNACGRFGVPALSSTWFNVGSVISGLALGWAGGRWLGIPPILAMSIGVVIGGMLQLGSQMPSLRRAGFVFRPRIDWRDAGLRRILALMAPAVIGSAAVQINVMVNTNFASAITDASGRVIDGPVSWLAYAFRFMQLPLGLFGVAIGSATLPAVSRSAALGRMDEFGETLTRSLGMVLLLTVPSSVGLAVLGESMIGAVYQSGRFGAWDTRQTALALSGYAVGLAGYAAIKVLAPALYALGDARTPMLVSVCSVAVNFAAASVLVKAAALGHAGLALSTSIVALFGAAALYAVLRAKLPGVRDGALAASLVKVAAASAAMGVACAASSRAVHAWLGASRGAHLADTAISIPLGVAFFCALAFALRVPEMRTAWSAACYTFGRNASRSEVGGPVAGS